jgi:hypothetical protein
MLIEITRELLPTISRDFWLRVPYAALAGLFAEVAAILASALLKGEEAWVEIFAGLQQREHRPAAR